MNRWITLKCFPSCRNSTDRMWNFYDSFEIVSCLSTSASHTVRLLNLYLENFNFLVMVSKFDWRDGASIMAFLLQACPMDLGHNILNCYSITLTFKDWVWKKIEGNPRSALKIRRFAFVHNTLLHFSPLEFVSIVSLSFIRIREGLRMVVGVFSLWILLGVLATTHGTSTRRDECTAYEGSERLAVLFKRLVQRIRTVTRRRSVVRAKSSGSDSDRESSRVGLSWVALSWAYTREQSVVVPHLFTNTKNLIIVCLSAKPAAAATDSLIVSDRFGSDRIGCESKGPGSSMRYFFPVPVWVW